MKALIHTVCIWFRCHNGVHWRASDS